MSLRSAFASFLDGNAPSRPMGVMRVIVGGAALLKLTQFGPVLFRLADPAIVQAPRWAGVPRLTDAGAVAVCILWAVSSTAFLVGVRTRLAGGVLTAVLVVCLALDHQLWSNNLYLLTLVVFLLTAADSGASLSVDARLRGTREFVPAGMVWLIRLQLSIVYFFTALAKVSTAYLAGTVLRASFQWMEWARHVPRETLAAVAVLSIALELFLSIGMWFAATRPAAFVTGAALHVGMVALLTPQWRVELAAFALVTVSMYLAFIDAPPQSRTVIWDDTCTFCGTWVRWFRRLDWLRVHRFVGSSDAEVLRSTGVSREEADRAIQLVSDRGRLSGFAAVRAILEVLPVSFLWAPALRLLAIGGVGDRAYAYVAARRSCRIGTGPGAPKGRLDVRSQ